MRECRQLSNGEPHRGGVPSEKTHCKVIGTNYDEAIPNSLFIQRVEVWLPSSGRNGKFMAPGGAGCGGVIDYPRMREVLKPSYATASTDTGHVSSGNGGGGSFAVGHPEKLIDYGYRAVHEMTVKSSCYIFFCHTTTGFLGPLPPACEKWRCFKRRERYCILGAFCEAPAA